VDFYSKYSVDGSSADYLYSYITVRGGDGRTATNIAASFEYWNTGADTTNRCGKLFPLMGFYNNSLINNITFDIIVSSFSCDDTLKLYRGTVGGINIRITEIAR
jgi:hypothetical protein